MSNKRTVIETTNAPQLGLPFSQAIRWGDVLFLSGQVGIDPSTGEVVEGGIQPQTTRALENISAVLTSAGTSFAHVLESMCFLADVRDFAEFNRAYAAYFPVDPPARTTVQAPMANADLLVEIRMVVGIPT